MCPSHTEHGLSEVGTGAQSGLVAWRRDGRPRAEAWGAPGGLHRLSPSLLRSHREAGHAGWGPQFTPQAQALPATWLQLPILEQLSSGACEETPEY